MQRGNIVEREVGAEHRVDAIAETAAEHYRITDRIGNRSGAHEAGERRVARLDRSVVAESAADIAADIRTRLNALGETARRGCYQEHPRQQDATKIIHQISPNGTNKRLYLIPAPTPRQQAHPDPELCFFAMCCRSATPPVVTR